MRALVVAEHNNARAFKSTLHAVAAAAEFKSPVDVVVIGSGCAVVADELAKVAGVEKIILSDHASFKNFICENLTPTLAALAKNYSHVLFPATSFGKNILPRLGAMLDVQPISDVIKIISTDIFQRPIYAGNAIATVQSSDAIKLMTIRPTNFLAAQNSSGNAKIESLAPQVTEKNMTEFVKAEINASTRPDLGSARVIISGGRGLGSAENFKLIEKIADRFGAAIGASRAAVDAGFVPNDYQVGQTGKIVAPELYIAVGISGAIQHVAGMKDSKVIVAINKDAEAPIFQLADYGLVGDLFAILPELDAALAKVKV